MAEVDDDEYQSAQEAFLVGRYLKENGLFKTLECFLKETPVKMVPKMEDDIQSLPQILRECRSFVNDREELKEKRKRMQQYEEILNLLFEELRDVYNFQSSASSPQAGGERSVTCINNVVSTNVPERQAIASDGFNRRDAELIEDFCTQNFHDGDHHHHHGRDYGKIVPVVLPKKVKQNNYRSSKEETHGRPEDSSPTTSNTSTTLSCRKTSPNKISHAQQEFYHNTRSEGQPDSRHTLEHHYNRIREHRRLNGRFKHRLPDKHISPTTFVAYSSLPVSCSEANSCGHGRPATDQSITNSTRKHSRPKKPSDPNACEPHKHSNDSSRFLYSASTESLLIKPSKASKRPRNNKGSSKASSHNSKSRFGGEGSATECSSNQLIEEVNYEVNDAENHDDDGGDGNRETRSSSPQKFDRNLGKVYKPHQQINCLLDEQSSQNSMTEAAVSCCPNSTAVTSPIVISEDNQLIKRDYHHLSCGNGHYKAHLRGKFSSKTRRRESTTIHQQELLIQHEHYCSCSSSSSPSFSASSLEHYYDHIDHCSRSPSNKYIHNEGGVNRNAALLATETANLLERLLPLVADPGTMKSFISSLYTMSPQPSPRGEHNHGRHHHSHRHHHGLQHSPTKADTISRTCDTEDPTSAHDDGEDVNDDDASVLAELEEAVARTVDDILERYNSSP